MHEKVRTRLSAWSFVRTQRAMMRRPNERTNAFVHERPSSVLRVYVHLTLEIAANCVRIPRRRRVGCFLLPVVSVIRSSPLTNERTNERPLPECNREFTRKMNKRTDRDWYLYIRLVSCESESFFLSAFEQTRFLDIIIRYHNEKEVSRRLALPRRFGCRCCCCCCCATQVYLRREG